MRIKKIITLLMAAVMLAGLAACGAVKGNVSATLEKIYDDRALKQHYIENPEMFMQVAQSDIALTKEQAKDFLENSQDWQVYALNVELINGNEQPYTFVGFELKSKTEDGFYFSNCPVNSELSLPNGEEAELYPASVVVDSRLVDIQHFYELAAQLEFYVLCYPTPDDDNEEVPEEDYIKIKVENKLEAPKSEDKPVKGELDAKRTTIEDGSAYLDSYRNNDIAFVNQAKLYGMDSETAAKVLAKNGGWQCLVLYINVENKIDEDITIHAIKTAANGESGVWLSSISLNGEFGLAPGGSEEMPVEVLVDTSVTGEQAVEELVAQLEIELEYSTGDMMDEYGNENINARKTAQVK